MKKKEMIPLTIKGVILEEQKKIPVILLANKQLGSVLALPLGPSEASAIIVELEGARPPRPLTHDLFADFLDKHHFTLERVEIYGKMKETYFSRIVYSKGLKRFSLECRPSDGIALCLRRGAAITADRELLQADTARNSALASTTGKETFLYLDAEKSDRPLM